LIGLGSVAAILALFGIEGLRDNLAMAKAHFAIGIDGSL
jgi:hypothetical protein